MPCVCRFKEAMLLDCDVVLRRDPAYMFDAPRYKERGNYFWGDIYGAGMVNDAVFEYVGALMCLEMFGVLPSLLLLLLLRRQG